MSTTSSCTFGGFSGFSKGWYNCGTGTFWGYVCIGKDSNGHSRCGVIKFTTPDFQSYTYNRKVTFKIALYSNSGGYNTYHYRISTTAPSYSEGSNQQISFPSSYICSGDWSVWTQDTYYHITLPAETAANYEPNTTYYLWMWGDTPTGDTNFVCAANDSSVGNISIDITYETAGISTAIISLEGYSGFYGGMTLHLKPYNDMYPYVYMKIGSSKDPTYGTYSKCGTNDCYSYYSARTDLVSRTAHAFATNIDFGSSFWVNPPSCTTFICPRYACAVYRHSSSYTVYSGSSGTFNPSYSGATFAGLQSSSTSYPVQYSANWDTYGPQLNGKVWYGIYTQSKTIKWYRGTSTSYSDVAIRTLYGTNSATSYSLSEPTRTHASNSSYGFQGWATGSGTTSTSYSSLASAINGGYTTVYGVYKKSGSSSSSTVYYYRGSSSRNSVTKTTTVADAYCYGTGTYSGGGTSYSYGNISTSCLSNSNYSLVGWTSSSSSTTSSYSSATSAFNAGNTTIYGIYRYAAHSTNTIINYYLGTSTAHQATYTKSFNDAYYYGAGSHTGGAVTEQSVDSPSTGCDGDSNYSLAGWGTNVSSTNCDYTGNASGFSTAVKAGYTTIYGVFEKSESMTYRKQNGESDGTATVTNYIYGKGSKTSYRPTEPSISKTNWKLSGYSSSSNGTTVSTWNALWDAGIRIVYAIWAPDNYIYYGVNGVWKSAKVYYGINGKWEPVVVRIGAGQNWK